MENKAINSKFYRVHIECLNARLVQNVKYKYKINSKRFKQATQTSLFIITGIFCSISVISLLVNLVVLM